MKKTHIRKHGAVRPQRGTAMIIALMIMALLAIFVAAATSRVSNEARIMGADQANTEAYFAAQASLEHMSRDFSEIFDVRIRPAPGDIARVENTKPAGFEPEFDISQVLTPENGGAAQQTAVESDSPFAGLIASRTSWRMDATAYNPNTGAEVRLTRTLNNYTIPIFQFGIFYDDPMEHHPGPPFAFGGRVHTNGDIYMMAGNTSTKFRDRVTAVGEVVTDLARNGDSWTNWGQHVLVNDGTGTGPASYKLVSEGSVTGGPDTPQRIALRGFDDPDLPNGTTNNNWSTFSTRFNGNLIAHSPRLQLPLQIGTNRSPIELIKRGLPADDQTLIDSRYFYKPGIRVSLSNRQIDLPGGVGGVQLNATVQPNPLNQVAPGVAGYLPLARPGGGQQAVAIDGYRLSPPTFPAPRPVWIKVETVRRDEATLAIVAVDVTAPILSLGVTHQVTVGTNNIVMGDPDAIVKIQRFAIEGPPLKVAAANYFQAAANNTATYTATQDHFENGGIDRNAPGGPFLNRNVYTYLPPGAGGGATGLSVVSQENAWVDPNEASFLYPPAAVPVAGRPSFSLYAGSAGAVINGGAANQRILPFPIMMFDTREGVYNDSLPNAGGGNTWTNLYIGVDQRVPVNGVMGMIDFDVRNFRRLVSGALNGTIAGGLQASDIPDDGGIGWVVYFSDRRNDVDNDGEYDNENVYVTNPGDVVGLTPGEDVNHNGTLQTSYDNAGVGLGESATFNTALSTEIAAVTDTAYFRRAQRLVNGAWLPGGPFQGFTFASENGVYIQGDYNATGVNIGMVAGNPTPFDQYVNVQGPMVPASVVADAVSLLSNQWNDGKSFRWAYEFGTNALDGRNPTGDQTVRCALLMGDALSFDRNNGPNQGGGDFHLAGGVHNFKRFRENWGTNNRTVNYCGSLINLYNSVGNNGPFKCCNHIYSPPTRNWVFDANFLDINRLPPGTPVFQYVKLTGFRRTYQQDATD